MCLTLQNWDNVDKWLRCVLSAATWTVDGARPHSGHPAPARRKSPWKRCVSLTAGTPGLRTVPPLSHGLRTWPSRPVSRESLGLEDPRFRKISGELDLLDSLMGRTVCPSPRPSTLSSGEAPRWAWDPHQPGLPLRRRQVRSHAHGRLDSPPRGRLQKLLSGHLPSPRVQGDYK